MQQALGTLARHAGNDARLYHVDHTRCAVLVHEGLLGSTVLADRIVAALAEPVSCAGVPVSADPAIGLYDFTLGEVAPQEAFRRMSIAGDDARHAGRRHARYDPASVRRNARRFALLNDFGAALEEPGQLSLVYQPRVRLVSGERCGVEALIRWTHPEFGAVSPGEFVPLVEQTALVRPMTEWVVRAAILQARDWSAAGTPLRVSINASAMNLDEDDFAARLLGVARDAGVDASLLELEFTESTIAHDPARVIDQMRELRSNGVQIAIDDFGTGYSNLSYLQQLPVSVLKIDQAFVRDMVESGKDRLLVKTMIAMGHDLGYQVVAEGIETQAAYDMLVDWGCDEGQGYLMSRPVAPEHIHRAERERTGARVA